MSKRAEPWVGYGYRGAGSAGAVWPRMERVLCIPLLEGERVAKTDCGGILFGGSTIRIHLQRDTTPAQQERRRDCPDCHGEIQGEPGHEECLYCAWSEAAQQERGEDRRVSKMADYIRNVPGLCRRTTGERRGA